jgi:hypothetical protein
VLRAWDGAVPVDGGKQLDFSGSKEDDDVAVEHLVCIGLCLDSFYVLISLKYQMDFVGLTGRPCCNG